MSMLTNHFLKNEFCINESIIKLSDTVEKEIKSVFEEIDRTKEFNQLKVLKAMQKNKLSESHFAGTTGYGYDDRGREVIDSIYADVFKAEDALVRNQIVSGTHAISLCLFGNLRPGQELLSVTGNPYDTLEEVIGLRGNNAGSLKDFGVEYNQVDLKNDGTIDINAIKKAINEKTRMVMIQRSRGYNWQSSIKISEMKSVVESIKDIKNDIVVLVDNCYGEFVEEREPCEIGADLCAGSLIKNPGGGLALTGGYIVGKEEFVKNSAYRLTYPGIGKKVGSTLGNNRNFLQGFFIAPHVVAESLKGAVYCSLLMQKLGFNVSPLMSEKRTDIIQAIKFENRDALIAFCQGIQNGSPVDSFVSPESWDMPGYESPVIMAAGGFVQGSSIELSADAPIKPPYIAYLQGGLVFEQVKVAIMIAVQKMLDREIILSI